MRARPERGERVRKLRVPELEERGVQVAVAEPDLVEQREQPRPQVARQEDAEAVLDTRGVGLELPERLRARQPLVVLVEVAAHELGDHESAVEERLVTRAPRCADLDEPAPPARAGARGGRLEHGHDAIGDDVAGADLVVRPREAPERPLDGSLVPPDAARRPERRRVVVEPLAGLGRRAGTAKPPLDREPLTTVVDDVRGPEQQRVVAARIRDEPRPHLSRPYSRRRARPSRRPAAATPPGPHPPRTTGGAARLRRCA